ncbi:hypothetical protein GQ457_13G017890 [Hibiscus cannabinus]
MVTGDVKTTSKGSTQIVESSQSLKKTGQGSKQPIPSATAVAMNHNEKPLKFCGLNFKVWQQKMSFYLTMLNLVKYLKEDPPVVIVGDGVGEVDELTAFSIKDDWENGDYLCRNYILKGLQDSLYPIYDVYKTTKQLWATLDHKYKAEDPGLKSF